jgi:hypothetical protein
MPARDASHAKQIRLHGCNRGVVTRRAGISSFRREFSTWMTPQIPS